MKIITNDKSNKDEYFMSIALKLAQKSRPSPNPRVGAVIVKDGKIIGQGYHKKAGTNHAEINAINNAKKNGFTNLSNSTMYITLEPCCTWGKTSPCTDSILREKIKHVVISTIDPNPNVAGKSLVLLLKKGVKITSGILEKQAEEINEGYNHFITTKKPLVVLKAALSVDGKIASVTGESKWITNKHSRKIVHQMRSKYDAILVGIGTVLKDNPHLTSRIKNGINSIRIILDSTLKIPLNSNVLYDKNVLIFTTNNYNKKNKKFLEQKGIAVKIAGKNAIDLKKVLTVLGQMGITSILIEGGSKIYDSFLKQKLVDKVILFTAPLIIGGSNAPSLLQTGANTIKSSIKLKNVRYTILGDNILLEGYIK